MYSGNGMHERWAVAVCLCVFLNLLEEMGVWDALLIRVGTKELNDENQKEDTKFIQVQKTSKLLIVAEQSL